MTQCPARRSFPAKGCRSALVSSHSATSLPVPPAPLSTPWTCPFCALHCDGFVPAVRGAQFALQGSDCARAQAGLGHFAVDPAAGPASVALVDGLPATPEAALQAAAAVLARARMPLFGGLVTDIAGARSLYALAHATGAVLDHVNGTAQMHGVRALQDRGTLTTTLAEVRERADLIVCLGSQPGERYPEFFARCGIGRNGAAAPREREIIFVGATPPAGLAGVPGMRVGQEPATGDVFDMLALLNALVAGRRLPTPAPQGLSALAQRLQGARYAVLVWDMVGAPRHGALIAQGLHRLVDLLNRNTRAAALLLGGNDGALSVNQAVTWLSGLPLRTGVLARGLTHEPVAFAADHLLAQQAVDALLWVASFGPEPAPPDTPLPCVVLGHPAMAAKVTRPGSIFIPVSTPGIGSGGHLSRFDSVVVVPLRPLRADGLPTVAEVARRLGQQVAALKPAAAGGAT
jgi:formylmethanofuran dehydrogenase subunit B